MSAAVPSTAWADAFEDAHKQATSSHTVLLQGYAVHLSGDLGPLEVEVGRVRALVTPRHEEPCQAAIHVTALSEAEEHTVTGALAAGRHRNAVLGGQLPAALLQPEATGEVALGPAPEQISFTCACHQAPCQHTAALGHALAQHLRAQPAAWFILRGLPPSRLAAQLSRSAYSPTSASAPAPASTAPVKDTPAAPARAYLNAHHVFQAQPAPVPSTAPATGSEPVQPLLHDHRLAPPPQGTDLEQLRHLAAEAARQAAALLADGTALESDPVTDAVRRTTALAPGRRTDDTAYRLGLEPAVLRRLLSAYGHGGTPAVHTALHPQPAPPGALGAAVKAITPLRPSSRTPLATHGNQITDTALGIAVRYGPDARWYPFGASEQDWECLAPPADNPATAYRAALAARRSRARASWA
ncbi:hypothetical protein [Streptomyces sp. NPDC050988]|uniref:hypothetical protein n=1 Tax=Streptomyces sp. NPDC050988 TaxID=3365637 RepID=UPI00379AB043